MTYEPAIHTQLSPNSRSGATSGLVFCDYKRIMARSRRGMHRAEAVMSAMKPGLPPRGVGDSRAAEGRP